MVLYWNGIIFIKKNVMKNQDYVYANIKQGATAPGWRCHPQNISFMYNKLTKNTISVGTDCYKKFGFKKNGVIKNPIFYNVIKNILQKGEYEIIEDIVMLIKQKNH